MNFTVRQVEWSRMVGRRIAVAVIWATVVAVLTMMAPPLFARDYDQSGRGGRHVDQGQRDWRSNGARSHRYRHSYVRPYVYAQPVYVPPPVYYEPRQSPGISLFFPLDLRERQDRPRR
jgi:hypothetical protein